MGVEIIYEKKYPRINPIEEMKQIELEMADEPEEATPPFNEIMAKIQADTTYVLMPERIKASEKFIQTAIEVSELYELDTKIERHLDHISVNYSFNCCGGMRDINRVFGMADQFSFFKDIYGWDITVSLDFYTHAVVRNGRVVAP